MIYLADFTGHGVAAALNAARLHSFVHMMWQRTGRPGALLRKLNQRLNEVLPTGQFATLSSFIARRLSTHSKSLLRRASLSEFLATWPMSANQGPSLRVERLFSTATELVETPKPPKSILTPDCLKDLLNNNDQNKDAHQICQSVVGHLFSKQATRATDDITLLIARHRGGVAEPVIDYEV